MTRPEDTDAGDKAAWAGADADATASAAAEEVAEAEAVEAEIVDDAAAVEDGVLDEDGEPAGADADGGAESEDADLQAQLDERTTDLQRVSAEFANYRRRVERDRQATIDASKASVLAELLPIVDDLDRAHAHGDLEEGPLKVFSDKVRGLLAAQGVEEFGEEGDAFDPSRHEAVQDESEGSEPVLGTVLRKGYRHGERTLRTAMVIVR